MKFAIQGSIMAQWDVNENFPRGTCSRWRQKKIGRILTFLALWPRACVNPSNRGSSDDRRITTVVNGLNAGRRELRELSRTDTLATPDLDFCLTLSNVSNSTYHGVRTGARSPRKLIDVGRATISYNTRGILREFGQTDCYKYKSSIFLSRVMFRSLRYVSRRRVVIKFVTFIGVMMFQKMQK